MNVHYLFGELPAEATQYHDYLRELLAEAKPLETPDLVELKKKILA